jgi:hypothetical protein
VGIAASIVNLQTNEPVASVQAAKRENVIRDREKQAALRNTRPERSEEVPLGWNTQHAIRPGTWQHDEGHSIIAQGSSATV